MFTGTARSGSSVATPSSKKTRRVPRRLLSELSFRNGSKCRLAVEFGVCSLFVWGALFSVLGFGFTFWGFGCVPFSSHLATSCV